MCLEPVGKLHVRGHDWGTTPAINIVTSRTHFVECDLVAKNILWNTILFGNMYSVLHIYSIKHFIRH
jgi:hypothetical protein